MIRKNKLFKIFVYVQISALLFASQSALVFAVSGQDLDAVYEDKVWLPGGICDEGGPTTVGTATAFDESKLSLYEAQSGQSDPGVSWVKSGNGKSYAISTLGILESEIRQYDKQSEVIEMIKAEVAKQYNQLTEKYGTTLQQAQQALLAYQEHESASFQLFNSNGVPSYTANVTLDIMSLTMDKFTNMGKNKRAAASYDIKYAIYLGVKEHIEYFQKVTGEGEDRWKNTIGAVFWPSDTKDHWEQQRYWTDGRGQVAIDAWEMYSSVVPQLYNNCECSSLGGAGQVSVDRIIQTLAFRESGGIPTAQAKGTTASGKYQYLDGTWASHTKTYYPPASVYSRAMDAPESMQDAVVYIEYTKKFQDYGGDLFKIALSHFYPAAINDPSLLDKHFGPTSNPTPRQYAEKFVEGYNSGVGKDIPLKYNEAPDFATWLAKVGGAAGAVNNPSACGTIINGIECPANLEVHPSYPMYFKMPDAPNGEYAIYSREAARYGSKELVCALYTVGRAYKQLYGSESTFQIGDLNASGHKSHKWGVAVDVDAQGNIVAADGINAPSKYSTEATIALGKLFIDTGIIRNIWWCEPGAPIGGLSGGDGSMNAIREYANQKGTPLNSLKCLVNHYNHFHVDILQDYRGPVHEP